MPKIINDPNCSVVISTWNGGLTLLQCLESLASQTYQDFEIVIIDSGSTDGTIEKLGKYSRPNLRVEKLPSNPGFAAANNIGARLARGRWLALLNADAYPEPDWLENLISASNANPEFASYSSRQVQANNPEFLDGAGDAYHVSGLAWRRFIGYPAKYFGRDAMELFSPCAAAALYLREAFLEVGGFDEDFFSYFEDVDLGFRLQLRGYRCLYAPKAVVHHVGSATFGGRSDFAFYHVHRNLIWTFIKNMPSAMLWRYLPAHFFANLIYLIYYTLHGRGRVLWCAKWDAVKGLSKFIRKRQAVQENVKVNLSALARAMEHGWFQPYLLEYNRRKAIQAASASTQEN